MFYPPRGATLRSGWFDDVLLKCGAVMPLDPDILGLVNEHRLLASNWPDNADIMTLKLGVLYGFPNAAAYTQSVLVYASYVLEVAGAERAERARAEPEFDIRQSLREHLNFGAQCLALFSIYLR